MIDSSDFDTDEALKNRILKGDFSCGQCQMFYLIESGVATHVENDNSNWCPKTKRLLK
jgi:hypothetical protein